MTAKEKQAFAERMKQARERKRRLTAAAKRNFGGRTKAAKKRPAKKAPRGRRNPDMSAAEQMYTDFHGRRPNRTMEYAEAIEVRTELAELGKLIELRFRLTGERTPMPLTGFGACQVACTPDGQNIYFVGGDQAVSLSDIGIESDKDYLELGECTYIRYFTRKGFHQFQPVEYFHKFGEEDGIRPVLAYDALNRKLFLIGGNYRCRPEGIVN